MFRYCEQKVLSNMDVLARSPEYSKMIKDIYKIQKFKRWQMTDVQIEKLYDIVHKIDASARETGYFSDQSVYQKKADRDNTKAWKELKKFAEKIKRGGK